MQGIYGLRYNDEIYIGLSRTIEARVQTHLRSIKNRTHSSRPLNSWDVECTQVLLLHEYKDGDYLEVIERDLMRLIGCYSKLTVVNALDYSMELKYKGLPQAFWKEYLSDYRRRKYPTAVFKRIENTRLHKQTQRNIRRHSVKALLRRAKVLQ